MNFGGPVWHASAAHGIKFDLRHAAQLALAGVGLKTQEWYEWTGYAFHIRRRLTPEEQTAVGEAIDIRGTEEAIGRWNAVKIAVPNLSEEFNDAR